MSSTAGSPNGSPDRGPEPPERASGRRPAPPPGPEPPGRASGRRPAAPPGPDAPEALDAALRRLHGSGRAAELAALHARAAELPALSPEGRRFHLTHAWVHALEAGDPVRVASLEAELRAAGGL